MRVLFFFAKQRSICSSDLSVLQVTEQQLKLLVLFVPPPEVQCQGNFTHGTITCFWQWQVLTAVRGQEGRRQQINAQVMAVHLFTGILAQKHHHGVKLLSRDWNKEHLKPSVSD